MGQLQGASTQAVLHGALCHGPNIFTFSTCFMCLSVCEFKPTQSLLQHYPVFSSCALTAEQKPTAATAAPSWKQPPFAFWAALWHWGYKFTPHAATLSQPATAPGISKLLCQDVNPDICCGSGSWRNFFSFQKTICG